MTLRLLSFLAPAAADHYRAVGAWLAAALDRSIGELEEPGLARLREATAEPAIAFLCGLPYVRLRDAGGQVDAVAAPQPAGAIEAAYHAVLVGRPGLERRLDELDGLRIGLNGRDSLSGYVLPCHGLLERGLDPFGLDWVETGGHRASLEALLAGAIDAAPIDSTVLALERRRLPGLSACPTLAVFGPLPAPPVVVCGDEGLAHAVREALPQMVDEETGRDALARGDIERFVTCDDARYDVVRGVDRDVARSAATR